MLPRPSRAAGLPWLCATLLLTLPARAGDDMTNAAPDGLAPGPDTVFKGYFGRVPHGPAVTLYTLTNKNGMSVSIMDYGATVTSVRVPDRNGKLDNVVLGFDHFAPYLGQKDFLGATLGRYAGRIALGRFALERVGYQLADNDGSNARNGGVRGFDQRMWNFEQVEAEVPAVRFTYLSRDGEEGYPGNLYVSVTYSLGDDNELTVDYTATTDKTTVLNLANHSCFNLGGAGSGPILGETVTLHAEKYTPVDAALIPTGEIKPVADTPYDFRQATTIGAHLHDLSRPPPGYDLNYVLNKGYFSRNALAAVLEDPASGRRLEITTDQPGLQFSTVGFPAGPAPGREHKHPSPHALPDAGVCLEPQHFPDSPNHDNFPTTVLRPGEEFKSTTVYAFSVTK